MSSPSVAKRLTSGLKQDIVKALLEEDPLKRDSDERLCARYWYNELMALREDPQVMTAERFLEVYAKGNITSADDLTRIRRKLQEKYPHLRGDKYNQRKGAGKDVSLKIIQ